MRAWTWRYRGALRPLVYAVIWLVDRLVPKVRQAALAVSPDFDDQGLAVAEELDRRGVPIVWLTATRHDPNGHRARRDAPGRAVFRWSAKGLWTYFRSRYVFYTHGIFGFATPPRTKVVVNLLHGVPIKRIGLSDNRQPMRASLALATSPAFQEILCRAWAMPAERIPVTGLPRNDRLLRSREGARPDLGTDLGTGYRHLILWMPTYRRSVRGDIRTDGVADRDKPGGIDGFDPAAFDAFLADLDAACILKMHPMAAPEDLPEPSRRMKLWDDRTLDDAGLTLSELMGRADLLISDASNVWVDFLLLDRPIVFAFGDMPDYERDRGFSIDGLADQLPGPTVATFPELTDAIGASLGGAFDRARDHRVERERARALMHTHTDDRSAERVVAAVMPGAGRTRTGA